METESDKFDKVNEEFEPAPDANEPGDHLPEELSDLVTGVDKEIVSDEVDQPPTSEEMVTDVE